MEYRRSAVEAMVSKRFGIVGGGIIGLATALKLRQVLPDARIDLWEKESSVGSHQSTHNSGVLHAGLYYKPGSLKAQLAVQGIRKMLVFCAEHRVPHEICGKLVIAVDDSEIPRLRTLFERGQANGLRGLEWLSAQRIRDIEPHATGVAAVRVPEEGIVDYRAVIKALEYRLAAQGVVISTGMGVSGLKRKAGGWEVATDAGPAGCDFLINCAGLHCDEVAALAGERRDVRIVPFRGEYYKLRSDRSHLVRNLIYPVPSADYPFLGVHFTRLIEGGIEAGPNAVLALAREGYAKSTINVRELTDALTYPGLWRFLNRHKAMCWSELRRSFSRRLFCASLQRLVPELVEDDLVAGGSGVRAQALTLQGDLVQDFALIERPDAVHVINAPSPAATASLAIGEYIAAVVRRLAVV